MSRHNPLYIPIRCQRREAVIDSEHISAPWWNRSSLQKLSLVENESESGSVLSNSLRLYAAAKSLQSCPTLCEPLDGSPPGSPVPGILQARTLEWVAISFSNASKWKVKLLSRVRLFATPWTATYQAPPSMGFSRQKYWSGVPLPSPLRLYSPWNSLGQNTGVAGLSRLQGIFPTQGSNPCLLHCRRILYQLNYP